MAQPSPVTAADHGDSPSATTGTVKGLLRAEGALVLALAIMAYRHLGGSWTLFAVFFLAPDLTMAGYIFGPLRGALIYNLGHTYLTPACLGAL